MKKFFTMRNAAYGLAASVAVSAVVGAFAMSGGPTFTDVPATHWAYASIEKMADEGVMTGIGNNKFNPSGTISNGEFFTMLTRAFYPEQLAAAQAVNGSNEWWYPAAIVSDSCELLYDTTFGSIHNLTRIWLGTDPINREDMAHALYNLLRNAGCSATEEQKAAAQAKIKDWDEIFEYSHDAVATVYALGLITGTGDGTFAPENSMTRAEAAAVMDRVLAYGLVVKNGDTPLPEPTPTPVPTPTPTPSTDTVGAITPASQVKSSIGKKDAYPTKGGAYYFANQDSYINGGKNGLIDYDGIIAKEQNLSNNGYRTGANVEIGNASLVYELLDMVNEMRAEGGVAPVKWVVSDAAEEYTLLRAYETTSYWSHDRANGSDGLSDGEDIGRGQGSAQEVFNDWKNSPGHYKSLMRDSNVYMCAARCGNYWVITLWGGDSLMASVERYASSNYVK